MNKMNYFEYFPRFFDDLYPLIYSEVKDKCERYSYFMDDKEYKFNRKSCMFLINEGNIEGGYGKMSKFFLSKESILEKIKGKIERKFDISFDYVLVHIYEDGNDSINYHNDDEALDSTIASVSFGAARKFRFRRLSQTKGFEKEFRLVSGDLVMMWGPGKCGDEKGCQRVYKHSVPKELKVKFPRINLTFRQFQ